MAAGAGGVAAAQRRQGVSLASEVGGVSGAGGASEEVGVAAAALEAGAGGIPSIPSAPVGGSTPDRPPKKERPWPLPEAPQRSKRPNRAKEKNPHKYFKNTTAETSTVLPFFHCTA